MSHRDPKRKNGTSSAYVVGSTGTASGPTVSLAPVSGRPPASTSPYTTAAAVASASASRRLWSTTAAAPARAPRPTG